MLLRLSTFLRLLLSLPVVVFSLICSELPTAEKKQTVIEWQMDSVHQNPLHISLFNFLGWQNIGILDEKVSQATKNVQPITISVEGLDILLPIAISKDSLLETAGNGSVSSALKNLFAAHPPSSDAPWYLILHVKADKNILQLRQNVLAALPTAEIQKKYTKITSFEELLKDQFDWKPHITLGRVLHIDDIQSFENAFMAALTTSKQSVPLKIDASTIEISTRTSGKKGKLLKIQLIDQAYPALYNKFKTIQENIKKTVNMPAQIITNLLKGKKIKLSYPECMQDFYLDTPEHHSKKPFSAILNEHFKSSPYYILMVSQNKNGTANYYNAFNELSYKNLEGYDFFTLGKYRIENDLPAIKLNPADTKFNIYLEASMNPDAAARAINQLNYGLWTHNKTLAELFLRWYLYWYLTTYKMIDAQKAQLITETPQKAYTVLSDPNLGNEFKKDDKTKQAFDKWLSLNKELYTS